jgi:hypothetical protein
VFCRFAPGSVQPAAPAAVLLAVAGFLLKQLAVPELAWLALVVLQPTAARLAAASRVTLATLARLAKRLI